MIVLPFCALALAEDPSFAGTDKSATEAEKPVTLLSAELGGVLSKGNTEAWAVNGSLTGSHKWTKNKLSLVGGINVGQAVVDTDADLVLSAAERNAGYTEISRRYFADLRYDRYLSKKDSLYLLGGTFFDKFAGYDNRSHGQVGYSRTLVDSKAIVLLAEIGADVAREDFVEGIDPNEKMIYAAREMLGLTWNISESAALTDTVEAYENVLDFSDTRVVNNLALTAKVNSRLALKVSHALTYDNVPVEGFEKLDQTAMATIVVTLL